MAVQLLKTLRAVALIEATKGMLVILTGFGALSLIHRDVQQFAERLVGHLHLNPAKHFPQIFIEAASHLTDARLWTLAAFAAAYGLVRLIEAYGLWHGRRWAEWFAAASGAIYVPFELYELLHKVSWLALGTLAVNLLVVGLMLFALRRSHPAKGIPPA
ncbi:MAG: Uncharacterized protein AWT59_1212 [Candidatus Gallionella acididurans]|uniref:DUF2127 domain-containing protein n=1 Tax=Candidatus Gallionella acididurans TaxID=1796491 RepID=A0A139BVF9_9PROT|nr:MAG: Uncharacterized protein AWT59_1212 [Candidatus Gallionella acididurans]